MKGLTILGIVIVILVVAYKLYGTYLERHGESMKKLQLLLILLKMGLIMFQQVSLKYLPINFLLLQELVQLQAQLLL